MEIKTGGNPTLRRNHLHHNGGGVLIQDSGLGTLEDNEINGNGFHGVEIRTKGTPTLRRNRIHHNSLHGVLIHQGGGGVIQDNEITGNASGAWSIAEDCKQNVNVSGNTE